MSGGWDCHAHGFGPYARYPLAEDRSYTPPEASVPTYLTLLRKLGLTHGVLVQPSAYGEDHTLLLDALEANPTLRGVAVMRQDTGLPLSTLHRMGVRGARFSHRSGSGSNFSGSASLDDLLCLAPRLADVQLHAELWTDCKVLPSIQSTLRALPLPLVIDHMGGFDAEAGIDDPGFRTLLSLLETGKVWVKMCAYRNLFTATDPQEGRRFHDALLRTNPDRLVWGSDWPHLRVSPLPSTEQLLATLHRWTPHEPSIEKILQINPAGLYA